MEAKSERTQPNPTGGPELRAPERPPTSDEAPFIVHVGRETALFGPGINRINAWDDPC
ncbi:MAG: hypothetical protein ACRD0X_01670 [Thermoanaerobaculia bacterium]